MIPSVLSKVNDLKNRNMDMHFQKQTNLKPTNTQMAYQNTGKNIFNFYNSRDKDETERITN